MKKLPEKDELCVKEVAKFFDVSVKTVYRWGKDGRIQRRKIGGTVSFSRQDVIEFYDKAANA